MRELLALGTDADADTVQRKLHVVRVNARSAVFRLVQIPLQPARD